MNALAVATVDEMETAAQRHAAVRPVKPLDAESRRWLDELHRPGPARDEALVAADLGIAGPEEPAECLMQVGTFHQASPLSPVITVMSPSAAR